MQRQKERQNAQQDFQKRLGRRDKAIERFGERSRPFIREFSDLGVTALLTAASEQIGESLLSLHESGALGAIRDPRAALDAATRCGSVGLAWLAGHHKELEDAHALAAFTEEPEEFVHGFKDLQKYAHVNRLEKEDGTSAQPAWLRPIIERAKRVQWQGWLLIGAVAACVIGLIQRRRRTA